MRTVSKNSPFLLNLVIHDSGMPEAGSTVCYQKYNKFSFWPAEYLSRVLDTSHPASHCSSQSLSPAVRTQYHTFFPLAF